jgi:hypothetical protein
VGSPLVFLNHNINGCHHQKQLNCPLNEQQNQFQRFPTDLHCRQPLFVCVDVRHHRNLRVPSDNHRAGELRFTATNTGTGTNGGTGGFVFGRIRATSAPLAATSAT